MKNFSLLFVFLLLNFASNAQQIMDKEAFTQLYLKALVRSNPHTEYRILNPLEIHAKNGEKEVSHDLDKAYQEYQQAPEQQQEVMARYVNASMLLYIEQAKIKAENIVPVIKPRTYLDYLKQLNEEQGSNQEAVYEDYNEDLIIVYAEDQKNSISYFGKEAFEKLNISRDTLRYMAVKNLNRIIPSMDRRGDKGRYMLTAGGDYEASLILMPGIWNRDNFPVEGKIVIGIPNRNVLFVTGSECEEKALDELEEMCMDSYRTGSNSISKKLFIWTGEKFMSWEE